jgi:hypothetical protein
MLDRKGQGSRTRSVSTVGAEPQLLIATRPACWSIIDAIIFWHIPQHPQAALILIHKLREGGGGGYHEQHGRAGGWRSETIVPQPSSSSSNEPPLVFVSFSISTEKSDAQSHHF